MSRILSDEEYAAVTAYLVEVAGLVFDGSRRPGLSTIVHDRMADQRLGSVAEYLTTVATRADERQRLLDEVTIQETHFFRNLPQVEALRTVVLPELAARAVAESRPLTIWSAGCSTGEEPYTVGMLALELAQRLPVPVRILGTDLSASALATARAARYGGRTVQLAEDGATQRWFRELPGGGYEVRDEVRALVEFRLHNLVTEPPPFAGSEVDLVLCRNVTIYFSRETTQALVHRFHGCLRDGGYLVLGHAETLWQVSEAYQLVPVGEAFVYRKERADQPPRVPSAQPPRRPPRPRLRGAVARMRPRPTEPTAVTADTSRRDLADARAALAAGHYQDAAQAAARATERDPLLVDAYVVRGQALSTLGDDGEAAVALRKAVYLDPSAGHAHFLLGGALARHGERAAAASAFEAAARTLPAVPSTALDALLDGRAVQDLVDLCTHLADTLRGDERRGTVEGSARSGGSRA